jgi:hypothetical protein
MEIVTETKFQENISPEEIKTFYLYMTEDAKMKPQVYFGYSPTDTNKACDYLGTYNMPMRCLQIKGTETEILSYRDKLENERTLIYNKYISELGKTKNG